MDRSKGGELPEDIEGGCEGTLFMLLKVLLFALLLFMTGSHENELSKSDGIELILPKRGDLGNEVFDPDGDETLHSLVPADLSCGEA